MLMRGNGVLATVAVIVAGVARTVPAGVVGYVAVFVSCCYC